MKKKKKEIEWKYLALIQLWLYFNLDLCILDFIENRKKKWLFKAFLFFRLYFRNWKSFVYDFNDLSF